MKGVWVLFTVGFVHVFGLAGLAQAAGTSFFDGFLAVVAGNARVEVPGRTLEGAEIRSNELYRHGTCATRMKLPHAPSSITGFFLYRPPPDHEREIDTEVSNDSSRRIMSTTYANGRHTHTVTKSLPFDPTAGYHTYAFRYEEGLARFIVYGQVMKTWKTVLPKGSMYLYTNLWFPGWPNGEKPLRDSCLQVDGTRYTS